MYVCVENKINNELFKKQKQKKQKNKNKNKKLRYF
jgi:hypothetical protein